MKIKGLENYYLYHTSIGEVYYEMNEKTEAKKFYEKALKLTASKQAEQLINGSYRSKKSAFSPIAVLRHFIISS